MSEREDRFFEKVKEICIEPGKPYQFDCPICGQFAMGFRTPNGDGYIASCNTCHFSGKINADKIMK